MYKIDAFTDIDIVCVCVCVCVCVWGGEGLALCVSCVEFDARRLVCGENGVDISHE